MRITGILITVILGVAICFSGMAYRNSYEERYAMNQHIIPAENLAAGQHYNSSAGLMAEWAFDQSNGTAWQSFSRKGGWLEVDFGQVISFDTVVLREAGLDVKGFRLQGSVDGKAYQDIYMQDKIEHYRLCTFDEVEGQYLRLYIENSDKMPAIRSFEVYNVDPVADKDFRVTAYISVGHLYDMLMNDAISMEEVRELFQSQYYDTVTDVFFIFDIRWDQYGEIHYDRGEEQFTRAMTLFKEVVADRDVNTFVTILNPHDNGEVMKSITDNKALLIDSMIQFANKYELDGIDLDWEFPFSQEEFDAYNIFLRELKQAMVTRIKSEAQLSLALATWALRYEPETIEIIDQIQVMGYDILDQDGNHASFYGGTVQPMQYLLDQGFDKKQLNLGMPFYGTYKEGRMEQYLYHGVPDESITEWKNNYDLPDVGHVWFNSPAMLKDKTAYALYADVGGVMIFSLYCDVPFDHPYSMTKAVGDVLKGRMEQEGDSVDE